MQFFQTRQLVNLILGLFQANETENEVSSDFGFKFQGGERSIRLSAGSKKKCLFRLLYPECRATPGFLLCSWMVPVSMERATGDLVWTSQDTM